MLMSILERLRVANQDALIQKLLAHVRPQNAANQYALIQKLMLMSIPKMLHAKRQTRKTLQSSMWSSIFTWRVM